MRIPVLDHGYVELRNLAGPIRRPEAQFDAHDHDPAKSARMSFGALDESRDPELDSKLTAYLATHQHTTPFEMVECWMVMKLPIFVARQFVRHRTTSINEISGRYVPLPDDWYIPDPAKVGLSAANVKQGRAEGVNPNAEWFCGELNKDCKQSYGLYLTAIAQGIPNELARLALHLNHYTIWLWKQDLHNMTHFLHKRLASDAQWEAQQYGQAIRELLSRHLPELTSRLVP